jgi:hypothetical protein
MGNTYEVTVFGESGLGPPNDYREHTVYMGESLVVALWTLWKHRNDGTGCVTFNYRRRQYA